MPVIMLVPSLVPEVGLRSSMTSKTLNVCIGSAITYIPLSINLPSHFQQLKERQASYASTEAWWLSEPESTKAESDVTPLKPMPKPNSSHSVTLTQALPDLQHELQFAIDTPLIPFTWLSGEFPLPKTSDTHPIGCVLPPSFLIY